MTDRNATLRTEHRSIGGVATRAVWADGVATPGAPEPSTPVLLLHGFTDAADTWRRLQRRLAEAGVTSLAVDQPSHGEAARLDRGRSAVAQYTEFAAAAAEVVGAGERIVVVGNSLGGAHALLLAQHHPERVAGVVSIAPATFDHPRWFTAMDPGRRAAPAGRSAGTPRAPSNGTVRAARRLVGGPGMRIVGFGKPWLAPSGFIQQWQGRFADPERAGAIRQLAMQLPEEYLHADPVDLAAVQAPVLGIFGTRDRLVSPSSHRTLEAGLADVETRILRGVGHMPQLERPGLTAKLVLRFLDRIG